MNTLHFETPSFGKDRLRKIIPIVLFALAALSIAYLSSSFFVADDAGDKTDAKTAAQAIRNSAAALTCPAGQCPKSFKLSDGTTVWKCVPC